ncbi:MAG: prepilin-type N-terminal cleavage/methylation domain-containing protein [Gemmatimonadaceae bacterium]|nr:prepilin-type N-terminal cleavage/methylation domain-containing protein [Gemmatimonadaceae bacterium]
MNKIKSSHRGFTLAEVLVTLAIIAVMAAVLLPALNQQLSKGDAGRTSSDLTNIQSAAQAFVSDVHRYPATLTQLSTAVGTNGLNADGTTTAIPAGLLLKWKGPYLTRDVATTGGGATISTSFSVVSSTNAYLTISVTNVDRNDFANLEATLDEGTASSTSSTLGVIRYSSASSILTFLALPIQ